MRKYFILSVFAILLIACNKDENINLKTETDVTSLDFSNAIETKTFNIVSNTSWAIEKNGDWFTVSTESGSKDAAIDVTVAENINTAPRSAKLIIRSEGYPDIEIGVNQSKGFETAGLYVLSEGGYGNGNADLIYYDLKTDETRSFAEVNAKSLGDVGNDLALYGSKLYCVVSGSDSYPGYVEVINPETGVSQKQIPISVAHGLPRNIAFYENKAYVTTYGNKVVRIDTASLETDGSVALSGTYPEGICPYDGKLYVCNSGQGSGTTISIIDITDVNNFTETETITVPKNPVSITATASGDIYFSTNVIWSDGTPSNLHLLNPETKQIARTFNCRASKIALSGDFLYAVDFDWNNYSDHVNKINLQTKAITNIDTGEDDFDSFYMVYNISANPLNGDIYLTDMGNRVLVLDKNDNPTFNFSVNAPYGSKVVPIIK
ncbi:MAG: hypothetical protein LBR10_15400 [Prevotellaceae bacterium]|nr:hypothetical protein [Prevotellaceae bacterium]